MITRSLVVLMLLVLLVLPSAAEDVDKYIQNLTTRMQTSVGQQQALLDR